MSKIIAAFLGAEVRQTGAKGSRWIDTPRVLSFAKQSSMGLRLCRYQSVAPTRSIAPRTAVRGEIVGDHDVPGSQREHEDLFYRQGLGPLMAPSPRARSGPSGLPPGARRVRWTRAPRRVPPQEIVRNAGFVEKDQAGSQVATNSVRSIVFGGPGRFF